MLRRNIILILSPIVQYHKQGMGLLFTFILRMVEACLLVMCEVSRQSLYRQRTTCVWVRVCIRNANVQINVLFRIRKLHRACKETQLPSPPATTIKFQYTDLRLLENLYDCKKFYNFIFTFLCFRTV